MYVSAGEALIAAAAIVMAANVGKGTLCVLTLLRSIRRRAIKIIDRPSSTLRTAQESRNSQQ